nr:LysR family transcriptional regulator [Mycobacterium gastri]
MTVAADCATLRLSSRMPELGSVEIFQNIAETGSLDVAVRELALTQQTVSKRFASVEAQNELPALLHHACLTTHRGTIFSARA